MSHQHSHEAVSGQRLTWAIILTCAFVLGEAIAGVVGHSVALLSDAGHNLADAAALGFSLYAVWLAKRPSDAKMTFGYHRATILAALVNAVSLVAIAAFILAEAIARLRHPSTDVSSKLMIVVALFAVLINVTISLLLVKSKSDLNMRSAYMHMMGDAISAAGVVIAGIVIALTGRTIADPIVSILIALLILWSSWDILKESVTVLMESTPGEIDMKAVEDAIQNVEGVNGAHDLHIWTVSSGYIACSCHIDVGLQTVTRGEQVLRKVVDMLEHKFAITHTTIQVEVEGCERNEMYCGGHVEPHHDHNH